MSMNKKMRQGFSMIELLFVMLIMAALAAIAIPNLSGGSLSAKMTSMKSDARNASDSMNQLFIVNPDTTISSHTMNAGLNDWLDTKFSVSKNNKMTVGPSTCGDTSYTIKIEDVSDPVLTTKTIEYDSCLDSTARTVIN